ncbi:MAG: 30S ribosomal protein S3 [Candidatus Liptonbacteria bacterium]|nr:30S ribosomal protein S3 [Candidatus Liptonbacteria bacterium]
MGHKVKPSLFRLGITKPWKSRWFVNGSYREFLEQDEIIRKAIRDKISAAGIVSIEIERTASSCRVFIRAARPGLIIGRGGKGVEDLDRAIRAALAERGATDAPLSLTIEELKRSVVSAQLTAQQIAWDLERRMPFRRIIKKMLDQIMQNRDIRGARLRVSGRLNGAEIARSEQVSRGTIPLQTLRANIDYGEATAFTAYGTIGVKTWINKGEQAIE